MKRRSKRGAFALWWAMIEATLSEERRPRPPAIDESLPLGQQLQLWRKGRGMSVEGLAAHLKMPVDFVEGLEAGTETLADHPLVAGQCLWIGVPERIAMGLYQQPQETKA